ncbi:MAG: Gfo/Idh/MocA family oxidoreductase [Firmicutes bacterium]|nr:Gfo/Idh/MocA family oxidoreductase [Bacillota bacterium]
MAVNVGIIGSGLIARLAHAPGYQKAGANIVATADLVEDRAKQLAEDFSIAHTYTDYRELLARPDIEAVSICVPNYMHKEITIAALEAGKHVLCEKPMAMTVEEATAMLHASEKTGKILMLGFNNRFRSDVQRLKKVIDSGELGDIYYVKTGYIRRRGTPFGWFTVKEESGGGPVIDLGVHVIDMTRYLMGNPKPVSVMASTYRKFGHYTLMDTDAWCSSDVKEGLRTGEQFDVEDLATAMIRFDNGATMVVEASWASNIGERDSVYASLLGEKAGAQLTPELTVFSEQDGMLTDKKINTVNRNAHAEEIKHFVNCVKEGTTPISTARHGVEIQQILNAIYESAKLGRSVDIQSI